MKHLNLLALGMSMLLLCSCSGHSGHEADSHDLEHGTTAAQGGDEHLHQGTIFFDNHRAAECGVVVETLRKQPFAAVIRTTGRLVSTNDGESSVIATSSGVVDLTTALVEGVKVSSGESLLTINSSVMEGGDAIDKARMNYEVARKEYERVRKLYEDKIVSEGEYNQALMAYENARIAYEPYRDSSAGGRREIQSPMNGFIKECLVRDGDYVSTGQRLLTIAKSDRLYLVAEVPERHLAELANVVSANFTTVSSDEVYSTEKLAGKLLSIGSSVGDSSFYIPVTFSIRNTAGLVGGSYVEVFLKTDAGREVIVVPFTALVEEEGTYFAYKQVEDEHYVKHEVKLGGSDGINVEVVSGLEAGDKVVTKGAYQLKLAASSSVIPPHNHEH